MRVVFLLTQDRGGPADLTVSLAHELAGRPGGPEVTILGPATAGGAGPPGGLVRPLQVRSKADLPALAAVSRSLRRLAPDIVHAQDRRAGLVSALLAGTRTPVVLTYHGVPDSAAGRWVRSGPLHGRPPGVSGASRLVADALVSRRLAHTVAPSQAMAGFLRRELRVPSHRLHVLPNGVALPHRGRHLTGIRTFATVSSFAPCKATPMLTEAFLAIAADHPGLRLRMIGDGDDRRRCEELARQAGRCGQVEFMGYRTDVAAQLQQVDAFVLPSLNENLPLALLEAMAAGLPCIAANVGGIPEALDRDCGVLVPPGDVRALRGAMELLIQDMSAAARLGAAARRRVAQRFSLSRCADDHVRLWSGLLPHRRAARPSPGRPGSSRGGAGRR
jgi:glycosyltransferase involved in cell wall biosynthesis